MGMYQVPRGLKPSQHRIGTSIRYLRPKLSQVIPFSSSTPRMAALTRSSKLPACACEAALCLNSFSTTTASSAGGNSSTRAENTRSLCNVIAALYMLRRPSGRVNTRTIVVFAGGALGRFHLPPVSTSCAAELVELCRTSWPSSPLSLSPLPSSSPIMCSSTSACAPSSPSVLPASDNHSLSSASCAGSQVKSATSLSELEPPLDISPLSLLSTSSTQAKVRS
mmetsp:Transcript_62554/g.204196  ORF Transcript_62554/g.204196 Transcript_62554/m.204196 type:complete len:223 (-) Transcript_62554:573-1241(-)